MSASVVSIEAGAHRLKLREKRDALIAEYDYLVRPMAEHIKRTLPPSFELDDLIQTGRIGLLQAATRFRPEAFPGVPFALFARKAIRGAMLDSHCGRNWTDATMAPAEVVELRTTPHYDDEIEREQLAATARRAIRCLDARSQRVIETHYSEQGGNFEATGKVIGIDRRRAREVHESAITKLRAMCISA